MKNTFIPSVIILCVMLSNSGCKESVSQAGDLVTIDVTAVYPKKELILQDFMEVEYIPLETNEEFLTQGIVMDIGNDLIVVRNRVGDGNLYFFDRNGKGIRKINRMGQGSEEYLVYLSGGFILDEENEEIFLNNGIRFSFIVFDLYGNFKRVIRYKEGPYITNAFNFDKEHILCMEEFWPEYDPESRRNSFFLISKKDGITKEVELPFEKKLSTLLITYTDEEGYVDAVGPLNCLITPFQKNWIITEPSSDTIYSYLPDYTLRPFMARIPSVQSMNPEIFLFPGVLTERYYFMQTVKKEIDKESSTGMQTVDLVYDTQDKATYQYTVKNADFVNRKEDLSARALNNDMFYFILEAYELVEAYEKGQLKGRLKEIAATLDEESNPVIMLAKYKK